jgi:hypothetical protein
MEFCDLWQITKICYDSAVNSECSFDNGKPKVSVVLVGKSVS